MLGRNPFQCLDSKGAAGVHRERGAAHRGELAIQSGEDLLLLLLCQCRDRGGGSGDDGRRCRGLGGE